MTREEAIRKIKAWNLDSDDIEVLSVVVPELTENEDERIRRDIIHYILYKADGVSEEQEHSWIAYLEKLNDFQFNYPGIYFYDGKKLHFQGNPAMEENPYDFAMSQQEKQKEPHYTKRNALFDKCVANCDPAVMKRVSDEVDEKLKEQNPVDIDYISGIRDELLGIEDSAKDIDGLTESQWVAIRAAHRILGEYIEKEQKPVEWSKEDENAITTAIRACRYMTENFENSTKQYEDAMERLKSLRPHWKPSEEQMEALNEIINTLAVSKHPHENDYLFNILNGLRKNLKSIPRDWVTVKEEHWKPREEQMGALNYAYCELFKREDVGHNILGPLQNLIDTLSKL